MLKRAYRLRKDKDFQKIYQHGRRYSTNNFTLYYLKSNLEYSQIGFVVSKKVSKKAVIRNKLRRRVSALIEEIYPTLQTSIQAIILIRKDFSATKPTDLRVEINKLTKILRNEKATN